MEQNDLLIPEVTTENDFPDPLKSANGTFITANTIPSSLKEMKGGHIIPVFVKDNEPVISHTEFIEATQEIVTDIFAGQHILKPLVRLSHPIKGRIPSARNKPAIELMEGEKTLYYERMAFIIEIPSIQDNIEGNNLSLTVGGVKAYNLDNLNTKKGSDEHFKVFIGFKNKVCTNLCVWTDGYKGDLKVQSIGQLKACIKSIIEGYNDNFHLFHLKQLAGQFLTEKQFASLVGRARMYQYLPSDLKKQIPPLLFGDNQLGMVCKEYYRENLNKPGEISLWGLYNLLTGANKTSYIDQFLDRSVHAFEFAEQLRHALEGKSTNWYLN
jgi:Domain of unknown function, B. Theta Gene description (DUF3871)